MDRHIITIEDPIEYFHKHNKSLINQREIGIDVPDFPEAIRRALRMDPDIILVGEMRDLATISAAITAAETGHIVFGTLHTNSAEGTVNRIIDVFPKDQQDQIRTQLSVAILGILAQALLPRKPKGLVAAYEMLVVTPAISNLIRENKTYRIDSSIQTGRKHGMILLDDSLFNLWRQGLVEEGEVMFKSRKPKDLRRAHRERQEGDLRRGRRGRGGGRVRRKSLGTFDRWPSSDRVSGHSRRACLATTEPRRPGKPTDIQTTKAAQFQSLKDSADQWHRRLGTIMVDMGYLDEDTLWKVLEEQKRHRHRAARQGGGADGAGQGRPGAQGAGRAARHEGRQAGRRDDPRRDDRAGQREHGDGLQDRAALAEQEGQEHHGRDGRAAEPVDARQPEDVPEYGGQGGRSPPRPT